ncbi:MAG: mechanosensitive ion channel domain-containing protein, partial [Verrucomicrobiota bacterium]
LGLRPVARNVVSGVYCRDMFPPGSVIEVGDAEATVREVGPVATRLESNDGTFFVIPNSRLISQITKGHHSSVGQFEKSRVNS